MFLQQIINGLIIGSSYVLIASGLTLIFGILDVVNLAHGEFYMLGGLVSYFLFTSLGLNFWMALILAMIIVGILGILVEKLIFKKIRFEPHLISMIVSSGLSLFLIGAAELIFGARPRSFRTGMADTSIKVLGVNINIQRILVLICAAILMYILYMIIEKTKFGKAMRACSQDLNTACLMGINIDMVFSLTLGIGCAMAAAAGGLMAPIFFVNPSMGMVPFLKAFTVVIMGGLGNVYGTIAAGLMLGVIESLGSAYISTAYKDAISFVILILILLFKPTGLFGRG